MYPLKFRPILKSLVWGGEKIAPFKHIETTQHNIGESWELSGVRGNESVVANGEYAGRTISELVAQFKDRLIGKRNYARTGNCSSSSSTPNRTSRYRCTPMTNSRPGGTTVQRARPRCGMW